MDQQTEDRIVGCLVWVVGTIVGTGLAILVIVVASGVAAVLT